MKNRIKLKAVRKKLFNFSCMALLALPFVNLAKPEMCSAQGNAAVELKKKKEKHPFMLPHGVYPKGMEPKEKPEELFLEAVVTFQGKRQAVINGDNYSIGDFVFGRKVIDIFYNRVTLEEDGKLKDIVMKSLDPLSQRFSLSVRRP